MIRAKRLAIVAVGLAMAGSILWWAWPTLEIESADPGDAQRLLG